jgi:hypothetical protein
MSFSENYDETVKFLHYLKRCTIGDLSREKVTNRPNHAFVDLSTTSSITPTCALVLAAELHRWRILNKKAQLQPKNVKKWDKRVLQILEDMGVLDLLEYKRTIIAPDVVDGYSIIKISAGRLTDPEKVALIQKKISDAFKLFDHNMALHEGIFEATLNSVHHAYPEGADLEFPKSEMSWWATASWNASTEDLRFMVYDQGVGIGSTLPRQGFFESLKHWAAEKGLPIDDEAALIRAAIEFPRSSTGLANRGKGLPQMKSVIDKLGAGRLRVMSGRGAVSYDSNGTFATRN